MPRPLRPLLLLLAALVAWPAAAQQAAFPIDREAFSPLADWPTPTTVRTASGRPGPDYWQQRTDYRIDVTLDPAAHRLSGEQTITYTNNSPEALPFLWVHVEQNLFGEDSRGAALTPADSRWRGSFPEGGYTLDRVEVVHGGERYGATYTVTDTRMRVDLAEPLAPGARLDLELAWTFVSPQYGADRMGYLAVDGGTVYEMAQWFPRMVAYDDVRGWNPLPYLGQGEFYLHYGDYDVAITVPSEFVVVATGAQQNEAETWPAAQRQRLAEARRSEDRVYIVRPDEVGQRQRGGTTTWRFRAENVRDFAWAASEAFILDGAGYTTPDGNDVLILSAYPREGVSSDPANPGWEEATRFGRHSIKHYSERWLPYPYPVAINVAGVVGGMEYPMIQFSGVDRRHFALFGVIDHELGHNWFPMIVGSDERRWAWMDEGLNQFINVLSNLDFYDENPDPSIAGYGQADQTRGYMLTRPDAVAGFMQEPVHQAVPIMTPADHVPRAGLGFLAYRKPAAGLFLLRDVILGPERFDDAFNAYIERWAYKHPQPADFFRTIEDVSGEDLAWFWRGWFYSTDLVDQAVTAVRTDDAGSVVTVANVGIVMPATLEVTFEGGGNARVEVPVEVFFMGPTFDVRIPDRRVAAATVDPDGLLPDVDRANNTFRVEGRTSSR